MDKQKILLNLRYVRNELWEVERKLNTTTDLQDLTYLRVDVEMANQTLIKAINELEGNDGRGL